MFPKKLANDYYRVRRYKLSDYFPSEKIGHDGQFSFTQLVETDKPASITFVESKKYIALVNENEAISCVIINRHLLDEIKRPLGLVLSENPRQDFFNLHNTLAEKLVDKLIFKPKRSTTARVHHTAYVERDCYLGQNVTIGPGAIILRNTYIDDNAIIGPNVVVGSEGLEYKDQADGSLSKVVHMGGVYIGRNVEIMANSVVSRDVYYGFTAIAAGTKIGPLCNIAHRSNIGENCMIAGNTTVSGSVKVGNNVWLGPSVTLSNGIQIGDHARVSLGSVVIKDVDSHQKVSGFFALKHSRALKMSAFLKSKGI